MKKCNYQAKPKSYLLKHIKTVHTCLQSFNCENCDTSEGLNENMDQHQFSNNDQKALNQHLKNEIEKLVNVYNLILLNTKYAELGNRHIDSC